MRFRPCIDIHNGKVKQIVGGSLCEAKAGGESFCVDENFVSGNNADYFAELYKKHNLVGGHIILLNKAGTFEYLKDLKQAELALRRFPNGFQTGGGITASNAVDFIKMGSSHIIVTSYVFKDGKVNFENLKSLLYAVGKDKIVLDLSCRKLGGKYYIVTDRWQRFTNIQVTKQTFLALYNYCDEFLVHAVDVEGKSSGIDAELLSILADAAEALDFTQRKIKNIITYAGGISSAEDISIIEKIGKGRIDFTIGSALDLFGGNIRFNDVSKHNGLDFWYDLR